MIKYIINNITTNVIIKQFKDGCMGVNINTGDDTPNPLVLKIGVYIQFGGEYSINDMTVALGLTVDALQSKFPYAELALVMPYIPYARQDRACSPGEAFSLRYVGKMINGMGFKTVLALDPHSAVASGCIDRLYAVSQFKVFGEIKQSFRTTYIVAPDAGAMKKCEEFAKKVGAAGVIICAKKRNMQTMEIEGLRILDDIPPPGSDLLVFDDICDGGRSFIEVAKAIRERFPVIGNLDLAVSHGLFTYGVECVAEHFDNVYTTNSYQHGNPYHPKLKVVDIW